MFIPIAVVLLCSCLVLARSEKLASLSTHAKEFRAKMLGNHGISDAFTQGAASAVAEDTTYSSTGWLVQSYYAGPACNISLVAQGFTVNTCYLENELSYMYQLVEDSCTGAIRQEFNDTACTIPLSTTALDSPTGCQLMTSAGPEISITAACTTSTTPPLAFEAVMTTFYRDTECEEAGSFNGVATGTCLGSESFECAGDNVEFITYTASECEGAANTTTAPAGRCSITYPGDDTADDAYYAPGDGGVSLKFSCGGPGSSSGGSDALSTGAIVGIAVGGAAFVALAAGAGMYFSGGFAAKAALASQV